MKITDGLLLQRDLAEEVARLKKMGEQEGWEYRHVSSDPSIKWLPTFDLEANHNRVKALSRLHRKLSRAISKANASVELDVDDTEYKEWL